MNPKFTTPTITLSQPNPSSLPLPTEHSAFSKWAPSPSRVHRRNKQTKVISQNRPPRIASKLGPKLLSTYRRINPNFNYIQTNKYKRSLTKPDKKLENSEYDNEEYNFILYVNSVIIAPRTRYKVVDLLGTGSFGQVVKCIDKKTKEVVAMKIVKNLPAYHNQGLVEIYILAALNEQFHPDTYRMVRLLDNFVFKNHLCLVFELLSMSLFDLIKANKFQGLSLKLVRYFMRQILIAIDAIKEFGVIHCDLKPENILLEDVESADIKVIDFGSACFEGQTVYSYIQSRFYRSPEVIIGLPYNSAIDMWSAGCVCFELFLGLPLFPGQDQHCMLYRMIKTLGDPQQSMISQGKYSKKYFNYVNGKHILKSDEEYAKEQKLDKVQPRRDYFNGAEKLEDIIMNYPYKPNITVEEISAEKTDRKSMIHFLECMLCWDPYQRWCPKQLLQHPFITEEPLEMVHRISTKPLPIPNNYDNGLHHSPLPVTPRHWPYGINQSLEASPRFNYPPGNFGNKQRNSAKRNNPHQSLPPNGASQAHHRNRSKSAEASQQQQYKRSPHRNSKNNRFKQKHISQRPFQDQVADSQFRVPFISYEEIPYPYDPYEGPEAYSYGYDAEVLDSPRMNHWSNQSEAHVDSPRNIFPPNAGYSFMDNSSYSLDSPRVGGESTENLPSLEFEGNSPASGMTWSNLGNSPYHSYYVPHNMYHGQPTTIPIGIPNQNSYPIANSYNFSSSPYNYQHSAVFGTSPNDTLNEEEYFGTSPTESSLPWSKRFHGNVK